MRNAYDAIRQVAGSQINVLIRGESGTGKELAARAVVALSQRADKPFIRLNCAALPENLIESELFGSERGAFTGATESRPGQIELADKGTLFLDEIATLAVDLQTKLLRVLEDRQVQRLGGRTHRKIDFRLICATNEPLEEMVRAGRFREDLYYRVNVVPIQLPALARTRGRHSPAVPAFSSSPLCGQRQGREVSHRGGAGDLRGTYLAGKRARTGKPDSAPRSYGAKRRLLT